MLNSRCAMPSIYSYGESLYDITKELWECLSHVVQYIPHNNMQSYSMIFITHAPLFRGVRIMFVNRPGRFMFCNEYSKPIHALSDVTILIQTAWRHNADACCHNSSRLATAPSATQLPYSVPLNGMFHQESTMQWNKLQIWKICNYE